MLVAEAMPLHKLGVRIENEYTSGDGCLDKLCMELIGLTSSRCRPPACDIREEYRMETLVMLRSIGNPESENKTKAETVRVPRP